MFRIFQLWGQYNPHEDSNIIWDLYFIRTVHQQQKRSLQLLIYWFSRLCALFQAECWNKCFANIITRHILEQKNVVKFYQTSGDSTTSVMIFNRNRSVILAFGGQIERNKWAVTKFEGYRRGQIKWYGMCNEFRNVVTNKYSSRPYFFVSFPVLRVDLFTSLISFTCQFVFLLMFGPFTSPHLCRKTFD